MDAMIKMTKVVMFIEEVELDVQVPLLMLVPESHS